MKINKHKKGSKMRQNFVKMFQVQEINIRKCEKKWYYKLF